MTRPPLLIESIPLQQFGDEPWWLIIGKVIFVFVALVLITLFTIWAERRVVGRMQARPGPNRTGPFGIGQSLADGLKLAFKEEIIPALADRPVYILAPVMSAIPAFMAWAVIPFGPRVSIFGHQTALQITDLPVGILFVLAMASIGVYGIVLAGWASGSTYPLLGSLRSAAQMISYEVALGLALVAVFIYSGSLSTSEIVQAQSTGWWYAAVLPVSFAIYAISAVGETNRAPFDLPEAESELVGGFHTEYSSLKFAMFFLAEYINMVTVSAVATTLFLGGWRAPWPLSLIPGANTGYVPMIWFSGKLLLFLFGFVWLRGTLPRLRYDQFMKFGWKLLVPIALVWILAVAALRTASLEGTGLRQVLIYGAIAFAILMLALAFWPAKKEPPTVDPAREARGLEAFPLPQRPIALDQSTSGSARTGPKEVTRA